MPSKPGRLKHVRARLHLPRRRRMPQRVGDRPFRQLASLPQRSPADFKLFDRTAIIVHDVLDAFRHIPRAPAAQMRQKPFMDGGGGLALLGFDLL